MSRSDFVHEELCPLVVTYMSGYVHDVLCL